METSRVKSSLLSIGLLASAVLYWPMKAASQLVDPSPVRQVNVFLGTSGDHGQLSPAASYPFSMLSIVPQTDPWIHTGYEYYAKEFLGFAHSVFEGVGCEGSGANLLVKPFLGEDPGACKLVKAAETASPGYYSVAFQDGIKASFTVSQQQGLHHYEFPRPEGSKGLYFDLSHTRANRFVNEHHQTSGRTLSGWVEAATTCSAGKYKVYYYIQLSQDVRWQETEDHKLIAHLKDSTKSLTLRIGWSSTSASYARAAVNQKSFQQVKAHTARVWDEALSRITVAPSADSLQSERRRLFYSLLYRVLQSPYQISETDGHFRNTQGEIAKDTLPRYNGWSVWDNYRTQLPLLSLAYGDRYQGMVSSLASLYKNGKKDYATATEPTNTVRTEHTSIVLLDAYRKGYTVDFASIVDSIKKETDRLDFSHPDKALESSYDSWALAEIYRILGNDQQKNHYLDIARGYRQVWEKEFADLSRSDIDRMGARGMYQGTVWQYRWLVPYDMQGIISIVGSPEKLEDELDRFFEGNYYSQANEPDIAAPSLYNVTPHPSKAQALIRKFAVDTVVQFYFNGNSRGINPVIGPAYKNEPRALLPTMDDDGGAMSGWFVFAAVGLFPACVGQPVYYLHVPLFEELTLDVSRAPERGKQLHIQVHDFAPENCYIQKVLLNGQPLQQNYLTGEQLRAGGKLEIFSGATPHDPAGLRKWISQMR